MSRISFNRRLYGLGVGALLLADLAGGAAIVVARASSPKASSTPAVIEAAAPVAPAAEPNAGAPDAAPDSGAPAGGAAPSDCGQGTATALAVLDRTPTGYVLRATVANNSDRAIDLDRLVVQAKNADGARTFDAPAGLQIASGATNGDVTFPDSASASAPLGYGVTDFAFHTAGRPDCAAR